MQTLSRFACVTALTTFLLQTTGCGYVLYPERRGQTGGELDPAVIIMDSLSLLLFVVPGVIAFAVDITNGTIYLPKGQKSILTSSNDHASPDDVHVIQLSPEAVKDIATLEKIISNHVGHPVALNRSQHAKLLSDNQNPIMLVAQMQRQVNQQNALATLSN